MPTVLDREGGGRGYSMAMIFLEGWEEIKETMPTKKQRYRWVIKTEKQRLFVQTQMGKQEEYQETETESKSSDDEEDEEPEKWKKHYSSKHRILLVGEGDFSFSVSLARAFGSASNLVSTTVDTEGTLSFSLSILITSN